jgi:lysophospholipase L1-like esterase
MNDVFSGRRIFVCLCCCLQLAMIPIVSGAEQKIYRIMAVGDSITEGGRNFSSYRYPLSEKLLAAGYLVKFVGSRTSESRSGPLRHEGYSGKNAEYLAGILEAKFRTNPADIVLIHAGHNHTNTEAPVPGIIAATEKMIRTVRNINPRVIVLVAQVIPSGKLPKYEYIPELNIELGKLVARMDTTNQPVIAVNMAEGFDWHVDTVGDHVHPNADGANKIAEHWFGALTNVMDLPRRKF